MTNYILLVDCSVHIPGNERSRTNPGHGYPAHTEKYTKLEEFVSLTEMTQRMIKLKERKQTFRMFKAQELDADYATTVHVKEKVDIS